MQYAAQEAHHLAAASLSPETAHRLTEQVIAFAKTRNGYTSLMEQTRNALVARHEQYKAKRADTAQLQARYKNTLDAIEQDLRLLEEAASTWANPFQSTTAPSDWLSSRFESKWRITPCGKFAEQAYDEQLTELWNESLSALQALQGRDPYTSITEALQGHGFERKRASSGLEHQGHPTFMRDTVRIAMRRGGLDMQDGQVAATETAKCVTIEAIYTQSDDAKITEMRSALQIVTNAADDLGVTLHINPFPIELGDSIKPLEGLPLKAFYEGMGFTAGDGELLFRPPLEEITLSKLLKHRPVPCSDQELEELANHFRNALMRQHEEDGFKTHHLFDPPAAVVRTEDTVSDFVNTHGYLSPTEAKEVVQAWKDNAYKQGDSTANSEKVVISLFDLSGEWSRPWREAGYDVHQFDIQAGDGVDLLGMNTGDVTNFCGEFFSDIYGAFEGRDVYAILAANPCTDFASSGARHFDSKDAAGITAFSVQLIKMTLATVEYFRPSVWAIENPTGRIERLGGLPPWSMAFDPNHFGEDYTKRTMLWGRMNNQLPVAPCEATQGSKMHRMYGGKSVATKNARSVTPEGFAYAFFQANNALDNPMLALSTKYDRLDRHIIKSAIEAGISEQKISALVDDFYYLDLDDQSANEALQSAVEQADHRHRQQPAADTISAPHNRCQEPSNAPSR